jgi:multiple sugar transport system substrate-binding protein
MKRFLYLALLTFLLCGSMLYAAAQREAAGANRVVNMTYWLPGSRQNDPAVYDKIFSEFRSENPGVQIEMTQVPWSEFFTKLNTAFAGGTAPDVFGCGYGQLGSIQGNGHVLPLDDYLKGWEGFEDIPENMTNLGRKDGKLYGVLMPEVRILMYRTDHFSEAGLDPKRPPQSLSEIREYARKLTVKSGGRTTRAGFEIPTTNAEQAFFAFFLMHGGSTLWDEQYRPLFATPEAIATLNYLNGMVQEGLNIFSDQHSLTGSLFENDLASMSITSSNRLITAKSAFPGNIAVALPPSDRVMVLGTWLCASAGTKVKQEAAELIQAILSPDGQILIAKEIGFVPTRQSAREEYLSWDPDNAVVFQAVQQGRDYGVMSARFFDVLRVLRPALEEVYYGKKTAEQALKDAAEAYNAQ